MLFHIVLVYRACHACPIGQSSSGASCAATLNLSPPPPILSHISGISANWHSRRGSCAFKPEVRIHQREEITLNRIEAILVGNQAIDIVGNDPQP